jgi:hypothetical protein
MKNVQFMALRNVGCAEGKSELSRVPKTKKDGRGRPFLNPIQSPNYFFVGLVFP